MKEASKSLQEVNLAILEQVTVLLWKAPSPHFYCMGTRHRKSFTVSFQPPDWLMVTCLRSPTTMSGWQAGQNQLVNILGERKQLGLVCSKMKREIYTVTPLRGGKKHRKVSEDVRACVALCG